MQTFDPEERTISLNGLNQWMNEIRPANNWMEQNIVILPETNYSQSTEGNTNLTVMCDRHGRQVASSAKLRFVALRDIFFGNELLAWPDILFGLSVGVPFLIPQNIKSNI